MRAYGNDISRRPRRAMCRHLRIAGCARRVQWPGDYLAVTTPSAMAAHSLPTSVVSPAPWRSAT